MANSGSGWVFFSVIQFGVQKCWLKIIVFSFLVGYTPVSVIRHINTLYLSKPVTDCNAIFKLHVGSMVGLCILRFAESINPLIYIIGSRSVRKEVKKLFGHKTRTPFLRATSVARNFFKKYLAFTAYFVA